MSFRKLFFLKSDRIASFSPTLFLLTLKDDDPRAGDAAERSEPAAPPPQPAPGKGAQRAQTGTRRDANIFYSFNTTQLLKSNLKTRFRAGWGQRKGTDGVRAELTAMLHPAAPRDPAEHPHPGRARPCPLSPSSPHSISQLPGSPRLFPPALQAVPAPQ